MFNRRNAALIGLVAALGLVTACSSSRMVMVPPRMDLGDYGTIGMIEFGSNAPEGVQQHASREFLTAVQDAQPGVPVLELGSEQRVLSSLPASELDPSAIQAIGEQYQVDAILFGMVETKEVKPNVSIGSMMESMSATAEIEASLNAKLYDTRSGATLWSRMARGKETVARLAVSPEGLSGSGASDPDDALSKLVDELVLNTTADFRPTWVRQRE
jgi:hypothetical protein